MTEISDDLADEKQKKEDEKQKRSRKIIFDKSNTFPVFLKKYCDIAGKDIVTR